MSDKESPERLPIGWTEQLGSRDGQEFKFYYNVITGQKFYSKDDLFRFVELGTPSQGTRQQTRGQDQGNSENKLMILPASVETNKAPDWLPQGWIMEELAQSSGRKYKRYIDPSTGHKFHSKPEVDRYLNADKGNSSISEQTASSVVSDTNLPAPAESNKNPDWLPQGWIVEELNKKSGKKYKRYIDPSTGRKFQSRPEVERYLNSIISNGSMSEQTETPVISDINHHISESNGAEQTPAKLEESQTPKVTRSISNQMPISSSSSRKKKYEVVRYTAEGLPPGWIKEIKIERTGSKVRKDPYYTDPASGYVFRSQKDALRYLETKNINVCATKARKREELDFLSDIPISEEKQSANPTEEEIKESHEPTNTKQSVDTTTKECADNEESQVPTRTPGSKRKRGRPVSSPSSHTTQQGNPVGPIDCTKSEWKKVPSSPCRSSSRLAGSKPEKEANASTRVSEAAAGENNAVTTENKGEENIQTQPIQYSGGGCSLDPCLEFAFKTLRGDIPVEANNLAAQGYNHQERASVNVGLPSFSDYARR